MIYGPTMTRDTAARRQQFRGLWPGTGLYPLVGLPLYKRPQTARLRGQSTIMATRQHPPEPRRPAPRLYLVTPPTADPARLADTIAPALAAADVAAVLVPLTGDDERALLNGLKALAPAVQGAGAALLLEGRAGPGRARGRRRRASCRHR